MVKIGVGRVEGTVSIGAPAVVTLKGCEVVDVHPLDGEEPFTLWMGGVATVSNLLLVDGRPVDEEFVRRGVFLPFLACATALFKKKNDKTIKSYNKYV